MQTAGYQWGNIVLFALALVVILEVRGIQGCQTGTGPECEAAPLIPGYKLAGEGFDVALMRRTGAFVINIDGHLADNHICTLCQNNLKQGQTQRLPAAVVDWREGSHCNTQLSSGLHHSVESLLRSTSSMIKNDWGLGLGISTSGAVLGGSGSNEAKFARLQRNLDKATFAINEISCTFYSFKVADHPQPSAQFIDSLNRLPRSLNTRHDRDQYRRLIDNYGTHYIHKVQLGGKVRRITAFRTCLAALKGFSESQVENCLNAELKTYLGFSASLSSKCENLLKTDMSMGTYHGIMADKIEFIGGKTSISNIQRQHQSEAYHSWVNSLHDNPDAVSYDILPLHELVEDPQIRTNLRNAVVEYIIENQEIEDHFGPTKCSSNPYLDHNCCPLQAGRGTLKGEILGAVDLTPDYFSQTDAYVKIFYDSMYGVTKTVLNNNNPVWNAEYNFGSVALGKEIKLEVWDSGVFSDGNLGRCVFVPKQGDYLRQCGLSQGILLLTYSVECDAYLTGHSCGQYSPKKEDIMTIFRFLFE